MFRKNTAYLWDLLYGSRADREVEFVCNICANQSGIKNGSVLDIGCGTGRFLIPLAERGWDATGVDSSADMLEVLHRKATKRKISVHTEMIDFKDFKTSKKFELALAFYSMIYIYKDDGIIDFFQQVRSMLQPGGIFLVNFFNLYKCWNTAEWSLDMNRTMKNGHIKVKHNYAQINKKDGIIRVEDFRCINFKDHLATDLSFRYVRYHSPGTVMRLAEYSGFRNAKLYPEFYDREISTDELRVDCMTLFLNN